MFLKGEKSLDLHHPHIRKKRDFGVLNNSIYLSGGQRAITSTSNGKEYFFQTS